MCLVSVTDGERTCRQSARRAAAGGGGEGAPSKQKVGSATDEVKGGRFVMKRVLENAEKGNSE